MRVDISVVDQILSNLVDNAIKYAGGAADRRIHLDVAPAGRWLEISRSRPRPGLAPEGGPPAVPPVLKVGERCRAVGAGSRAGPGALAAGSPALGGDLRLAGEQSMGATFTLTIPFA